MPISGRAYEDISVMPLTRAIPLNAEQRCRTDHNWVETDAKVTSCRYEFSRMNTLTFGVAQDNNHFVISFSYYARARKFSGEFTAPVSWETGTQFPIRYNRLRPEENNKSAAASMSQSPLFALGVGGSIVLSMLYLMLVYGCNSM